MTELQKRCVCVWWKHEWICKMRFSTFTRSGVLYEVWGLRSLFHLKKRSEAVNHLTRQSNIFLDEIFFVVNLILIHYINNKKKTVELSYSNWWWLLIRNFHSAKFPFQSNANFTDFKLPSGFLCHKNCVRCHFKWGDRICLICITCVHSVKTETGTWINVKLAPLFARWGEKVKIFR